MRRAMKIAFIILLCVAAGYFLIGLLVATVLVLVMPESINTVDRKTMFFEVIYSWPKLLPFLGRKWK